MTTHTSLRHLIAALPLSLTAVSLPLLTAACAAPTGGDEPGEGAALAASEEALEVEGQVCVAVQRGTAGAVADANLWEAAPTWNDGEAARLSTGTSEQGGPRRALVQFDLSSVPADAEVVSAVISLRQLYRNGGGTTVQALRATAAWDESSVTWGSFGEAFDPTPVASFTTVGGATATHSLDVLELAQAWVEGSLPNHGLLLSEQGAGATELRSSESPYVDERPRLDLCFVQASCDDGAQNGGETGVDCGGPCAAKCPDGAGCATGSDCESGTCAGTVCQAPVCGDGVQNGSEACDDGGASDADRCSTSCEVQEVLKVVTGRSHGCALLSGGKVKCWGDNMSGQLGLGDTYARGNAPGEMGQSLPYVDLGTGRTAVDIAAGGSHTCALLDDGSLGCWGSNYQGQLGIGGGGPNGVYVRRGEAPNEMGDNLIAADLGGGKVMQVALGNAHTCALLESGAVKCWGYNLFGQLGLGHTYNRGIEWYSMGNNLPAVNLGTGRTAVAISAGENHTCALLDDGSVKCWGRNQFGQLGLGDMLNRGDAPGEMGDGLPAVDLGTGAAAVGIAAGGLHTCAVLAGGPLKCWGYNGYGVLGLGDTLNRGDSPGEMSDSLPAVDLGTGRTAVGVTPGGYHTCARLDDASVKCWGRSSNGELGLGDTVTRGDGAGEMGDSLPAVNLGTGNTVATVSAGSQHTCALLGAGSLRCWGYNSVGQLGHDNATSYGGAPSHMGDSMPLTRMYNQGW